MLLLRIFIALLALGCGWLVGFLGASRLLPGTRIEVRLAAGLALTYWLATWSFEILGLLDWFVLPVIIPSVLVTAAILVRYRGSIASRLRQTGVELKTETRQLSNELRAHRWIALVLLLVGAHLVLRMFRTLATPAFGWDDFTYHLFRAGRWVQLGGVELDPAPDAWTYYEFFPWGGDLLWAWSLVWRVSDVLVPVVAIALWGAVALFGYAAVRELGQCRLEAVIVALAIAALPSQAAQMSTAYVDNAVLLLVLGASLFLLILLRAADQRRSRPAALLVGICIGLGLLVKTSFVPLALPAATIVLWRAATARRWSEWWAFCGGLLVAAPNLIFNWVQRGSPFYPFEIVAQLPYNEQHSWILSKYGVGATAPELIRAAKALVVNIFPLDPFLNLGLLGVLLVVLGIVGSIRLVRTVWGRWFLLWVAIGGGLTIFTFFSPRNSSMAVWWTLTMGRFLVPSLAGLMVSSALVHTTLLRSLLVPVMVVEYFFYAGRGWPVEQIVATVQVAAIGGLVVVAGVVIFRRRYRAGLGWLMLALVVSGAMLGLIVVREGYRYTAYRLFADRQLLDFHGAPPAAAWPIWRRLDETGPQRVAATAGFDGLTGHNWFRGPLLGAWLQNEVLYLPVTTDGQLISYQDPEALAAVADRRAWLTRIRDRGVDRVVAMGPFNIEHRWILDLEEIFEVEISMGDGRYLLVKVDQQALSRHLSKG